MRIHKRLRKVLAVLMALMMVAMTASVSLAAGPSLLNSTKVTKAKNAAQFLSAAEAMLKDSKLFDLSDYETSKNGLDLSDKYQTGRILVKPDTDLPSSVLKSASNVISFNGWYFLQFNTENATKNAYKALKADYGTDNVVLDSVFKVDLPKAVSTQKIQDKDNYLSWGIKNMGMDKVQRKLKATGNKTKVTVAIIDTGISLFESGIQDRITDAFDFVALNPFPLDLNGHGTHCASTIIDATPDNVKIMPIKTMTAIGFGTNFHTIFGLVYAYYMGADIVNMSLGGEDPFQLKPYDAFLKDMVDAGMTICVAAGNEAADVQYSYPASSQYVITVGATKMNNRVDKEYSNYGSKVDFVAPGTEIEGLSTVMGIPLVAYMSGTSMATPHITAACALIKCVYPKYNQKQIYAVLKKNAIDIEAMGKDKYAGWGRIDLTNFAKQI